MHDRKRRANDVLAQIVKFGIGQRFAGKAELDDRHIRGAIAQYQGRCNVRRHVLEHHQRAAGELRNRARHVGALVKVDLFHADAFVADGFDARNVVHQRGKLTLVQRQDAILDVLRAHAVIGPHDRHYRDVNLREDVHRHAQRRSDTH